MTKLYLPIDATILPQKKNEEEKRGGTNGGQNGKAGLQQEIKTRLPINYMAIW